MAEFLLGFLLGVASVFVVAFWGHKLPPKSARPTTSSPVTFENTDVATVLRGVH